MISYKLNKFSDYEQDLKVNLMASEIEDRLLQELGCNATGQEQLTQSLYDLSAKLGYLENQLGWDNPQVWRMKKYYSLLELRHWIYLNQVNEKCGLNYTTILYFYSNKGDCPKCESQEFVLNHLKKKNNNTFIYSFDINMDNAAINTIKQIYAINTTPTLVINKNTFSGFMSLKEVEKTM